MSASSTRPATLLPSVLAAWWTVSVSTATGGLDSVLGLFNILTNARHLEQKGWGCVLGKGSPGLQEPLDLCRSHDPVTVAAGSGQMLFKSSSTASLSPSTVKLAKDFFLILIPWCVCDILLTSTSD